jgi:arylformamidase
MRTYDISLSISPDLVVWPDDSPIEIIRKSKIEDGADMNTTHVQMSAHSGTHIDAPFHFLESGETVENIALDMMIGRVYVLHVPGVKIITREMLEKSPIPPRTKRILFKTDNSDLWTTGYSSKFKDDYVSLDVEAAKYMIKRGVKLVGIDYLSIAPFNDPIPTHKTLLESGVVILEGINLSEVSQGRYTLYCLPLKISGSDGAPARAILQGV